MIADYQRPYAWGQKQLTDLWEDLDLLGPAGRHYAGTIVVRDLVDDDGTPVESETDEGAILRHSEVVDGQQRLTTCLLLLDRIRRRLQGLADTGVEAAEAVARGLRSNYGFLNIDKAARPRLRLGADLNDYWVDVILGDHKFTGPTLLAGQERLQHAATFFDGKLQELAENATPDTYLTRLRELQRRVTAGLGFLVYEVQNSAEVGVIFETLNERGRPLSDLEKTKNYLLYLARGIQDGRSQQLADDINKAWSAIFSSLAREVAGQDDQLLRAHWLATQNPDPRLWKRIDSIKARFDRSLYISGETRLVPTAKAQQDQEEAWDQLFTDVRQYVRSLRDCAFFLAEMFDAEAKFAAFDDSQVRVRQRSAALRRSGVIALYRPLLFAARLRNPADGRLYADLVDLCERYTARVFVIEQRRANAGETRLIRLAYELYNGASDDYVLEEMRALLWRYAPDDRVRTTLESTDENWYWRRGHKYFLYEYELSHMQAGEQLPSFTTFTDAAREQRTTEHILPQHPRVEDTSWSDAFTEDEQAVMVHALGNLALTLDNSAYSNKAFIAKRGTPLQPGDEPSKCYAQASLHQERRLAQYSEWTPDTIKSRQKDLAAFALQRWHLTAPSLTTAEQDPAIEPEGTDADQVGQAGE
jgi:hypothetical protein